LYISYEISDEFVHKLRQLLPNCDINYAEVRKDILQERVSV